MSEILFFAYIFFQTRIIWLGPKSWIHFFRSRLHGVINWWLCGEGFGSGTISPTFLCLNAVVCQTFKVFWGHTINDILHESLVLSMQPSIDKLRAIEIEWYILYYLPSADTFLLCAKYWWNGTSVTKYCLTFCFP